MQIFWIAVVITVVCSVKCRMGEVARSCGRKIGWSVSACAEEGGVGEFDSEGTSGAERHRIDSLQLGFSSADYHQVRLKYIVPNSQDSSATGTLLLTLTESGTQPTPAAPALLMQVQHSDGMYGETDRTRYSLSSFIQEP